MKVTSQCSTRAGFKSLFHLFYQNGSRTYRGLHASGARVRIWIFFYILRD